MRVAVTPRQDPVPRPPQADRLPLPISTTMEEASRLSGIGKTMLYELINSGKVQAKKNGRITLILVDSLREHIARLPDWKAGQ